MHGLMEKEGKEEKRFLDPALMVYGQVVRQQGGSPRCGSDIYKLDGIQGR
jgi:hypothetical protein